MSEGSLQAIAEEAAGRWPVLSMVVGIGSGSSMWGRPRWQSPCRPPHRGDLFEAARFVIDELKERVPIWKREHWPGGAEWVEGADEQAESLGSRTISTASFGSGSPGGFGFFSGLSPLANVSHA